MPLQLPNLDDRRYNDLVTEALARIPTYCPEWTNHNPSDPGITLVELFAYLTDMLLYRLNRVTDDNRRKFLKLLGDPEWDKGELRDETRKAVLGVRERYRAVTRDDYEFLSRESFNSFLIESAQSSVNLVARAHCVPQRNLEAGTESERLRLRPEHVSVVIVPATERPNPTPPPAIVTGPGSGAAPQPTPAQLGAVLAFLDDRRMLTTKLHVVGPFYAHVSVQVVLARKVDAVEKDLASAVAASLSDLLDPLPSEGRKGWPFGRKVFLSDIYETLETIPGLDFVTDVMLSSECAADDDKCVVADPIWHADGDLIGLALEQHHLPVFDKADIVIAPNTAFLTVNLLISASAPAGAAADVLKRTIKSTVRRFFHPRLEGPGPATAQPTNIFVSDIEVAIKTAGGLSGAIQIVADCVPSSVLKSDPDRGLYIRVDAGKVVDWRTTIELS